MTDCPYVVMEVRKGIPRYLARVNEELTYCLCEAWESRYIERTYAGANEYVKQMEREDRRVWIE